MKAIILAAGQGTRLRPLTNEKPKCLVDLEGRTLLDHQLQTLKFVGIDDVSVVAGYKADKIHRSEVKLYRNKRFAETNMVATLFEAKSEMEEDCDLIISYGDIVYEPSVLKSIKEVNAPVTVAVDKEWRRYWEARMEDPLSDAETLRLAADGRILELGKKPKSYEEIEGQYIGLIKIRADYVSRLRNLWESMDREATYDGQTFENMYMTSFLQHIVNMNWEVRPAWIENGWAEVDCKEDLKVASLFWKPIYP